MKIIGWLPLMTVKAVAGILKDCNGKIADVACGTGALSRALSSYGRKYVVGMDILRGKLVEARDAGTIPVVGNMFSMPFREGAFDVAVCLNTLFNFPSLSAFGPAFREMVRILKRDGRIIIDIRNKMNLALRLKYWIHMKYWILVKKRHFPTLSYSPEEIETVMRSEGCRLVRRAVVGIDNPYLAWGYIMIFEKESGLK